MYENKKSTLSLSLSKSEIKRKEENFCSQGNFEKKFEEKFLFEGKSEEKLEGKFQGKLEHLQSEKIQETLQEKFLFEEKNGVENISEKNSENKSANISEKKSGGKSEEKFQGNFFGGIKNFCGKFLYSGELSGGKFLCVEKNSVSLEKYHGKLGKKFSFSSAGFTLVEIVIVIAIIGILGAVLYPLGSGYFERTRDMARIMDIKKISQGHIGYFNDFHQYPQATADGCVSSELVGGTNSYMTYMPSSPKGGHYNEGCGENGKYPYGVFASRGGYVIFATMEQENSGNYNGNVSGLSGTISLDRSAWSALKNSLREKSGKYYVYAEGEDMVTETPPVNNPTPPPTTPPRNCDAVIENGYAVSAMNHGDSQNVSKTVNVPMNGKTKYTTTASCNNGSVSVGSDTNGIISCDTGYILENNLCNRPNTPPVINSIDGVKVLTVGDTLNLIIQASDADNDNLTYAVEGLIEGLRVEGNKIVGTATQRRIPLIVKVSDGKSETINDRLVVYFNIPTSMIYRDSNGVTIKARPIAEGGKSYEFEGEMYYVAGSRDDLISKINNNYPVNRIVTTRVNNMNALFQRKSVNGDIGSWDTSSVTTMWAMFHQSTFSGNIEHWDVRKVTDMSFMFSEARNFNSPLNNWQTNSLTNLNQTFSNTTIFNQPINNWNTSKVTNMNGTFANARTFNQPLSSWNTSNVTDMRAMFQGASSFNQPIGNWDVSNITDMSLLFSGTKSFNQNISNWNTSNVVNMEGMFAGSIFNQSIENWSVSKVKNMNNMFDASEYNQPLNNWNAESIEKMENMFSNSNFNQPLDKWSSFINTRDIRMSEMFAYAKEFNQDISSWRIRGMYWRFSKGSKIERKNLPTGLYVHPTW